MNPSEVAVPSNHDHRQVSPYADLGTHEPLQTGRALFKKPKSQAAVHSFAPSRMSIMPPEAPGHPVGTVPQFQHFPPTKLHHPKYKAAAASMALGNTRPPTPTVPMYPVGHRPPFGPPPLPSPHRMPQPVAHVFVDQYAKPLRSKTPQGPPFKTGGEPLRRQQSSSIAAFKKPALCVSRIRCDDGKTDVLAHTLPPPPAIILDDPAPPIIESSPSASSASSKHDDTEDEGGSDDELVVLTRSSSESLVSTEPLSRQKRNDRDDGEEPYDSDDQTKRDEPTSQHIVPARRSGDFVRPALYESMLSPSYDVYHGTSGTWGATNRPVVYVPAPITDGFQKRCGRDALYPRVITYDGYENRRLADLLVGAACQEGPLLPRQYLKEPRDAGQFSGHRRASPSLVELAHALRCDAALINRWFLNMEGAMAMCSYDIQLMHQAIHSLREDVADLHRLQNLNELSQKPVSQKGRRR